MNTTTYSRKKAEVERLDFIKSWCWARGLDYRIVENFDRAAFEWVKENC